MNKLAFMCCGLALAFIVGCQGSPGGQAQTDKTGASTPEKKDDKSLKETDQKEKISPEERKVADRDVATGKVIRSKPKKDDDKDDKDKDPPKWLPLTGTGLGFSVDMPGVFEQVSNRVRMPWGDGVGRRYSFVDVPSQTTFSVSVIELANDNTLNDADPTEVLKQIYDLKSNNIPDTETRYRGALSLDGFPGTQYRINYPGGYAGGIATPPVISTERIILMKNRILSLRVDAEKVAFMAQGFKINDKTTRFFRSLKFTEKPPQTSAKKSQPVETAANATPASDTSKTLTPTSSE